MRKCRTLSDYAFFVAEIQKKLETMTMEDAVRNAVVERILQLIQEHPEADNLTIAGIAIGTAYNQ